MEPGRPPFLTPWAVAGRDALAVGGRTPLGDELLHLTGNLVFLVALAGLAARSTGTRSRSLRVALALQGAHVAEHLLLTATVAAAGHAVGVTTVFGLLEPGPALWAVRVAAHLGLNSVATVAAALAALQWAKGGEP